VAASPESDDAPVRALYLCGNRFVLINAQPFPVQVTWRIQGTDEQGGQARAAAPLQPNLERPHGQGAHQLEHRAPGLLHAVHPDLEWGAVEGQNHRAALSLCSSNLASNENRSHSKRSETGVAIFLLAHRLDGLNRVGDLK
jgi:hypothetical protein